MEENIVLLQSLFELSAQGNSNLQLAIKIIRRKNKRLAAILQRQTTKVTRRVPKRKTFLQEISEMPHETFSAHFGMGRVAFDQLLRLLNSSHKKAETGRPGTDLKVGLLITLWKLSSQQGFREVTERFNVGTGTGYRIFVDCVQMIAKLKQFVKFPKTEASCRKIIKGFDTFMSHPFPNVIGCIGVTHIRISQPSCDGISYYNRKGTCSIIAQAVADSEMRFLDVFVGHPGSCHAASVWADSPLKSAILSGDITFPSNCHLLGDAAYPLENYLMVPYQDNGYLTAAQTRFNISLSSTKVCLEHAFGILKDKFKILNYLDSRDVKLAKKIIMSCFVLHNFIIDIEGVPDNTAIDGEELFSENNEAPHDVKPPEQAICKRDILTTSLASQFK